MLEEHPAPARATAPSGKDVTAHCHAQNRTIVRSPRWSKGVTVNRSESAWLYVASLKPCAAIAAAT
jgi:hypothetical protein